MIARRRPGWPGAFVRLGILLASLAAWAGPAVAGNVTIINDRSHGVHAGEFIVPLHKTQVLQIDQPFSEIVVGDPSIADVLVLSNHTIYVLGHSIGTTNLTIYGPNRKLLAVADLVVSFDVEGLKAKLYEVMPDERIEVRTTNGILLLTGHISSSLHLSEAMAIAETFAPKAVTNAMSVGGSQQVLMQVRFAEIDRTAERQLGIHLDRISVEAGKMTLSLMSGGAPTLTAFATGAITGSAGPVDINAFFQALEKKGAIRILAEPNLIALSGDTASFLAGGEFPIPVAEQNGSISVSFKSFGVALAFTPTVIGDEVINLVVAPEVSQLDEAHAVRITPGSDPVPALTVRRAKTTIELRDGQSFSIAGLLQNTYANTIDQFPWVGDVPVLGALFRSADFQRNETELVIIVTVHLVAPASNPALLASPAEKYVPPSDSDLFLNGHTDNPNPAPLVPAGADGGGLAGQYGHIIK